MPKVHVGISSLPLRISARVLTDLGLATGGTILCSDFEKAVCIDFESGDKFSLSPKHWRNPIKLEFSKQPVITTLRPLPLVPVR